MALYGKNDEALKRLWLQSVTVIKIHMLLTHFITMRRNILMLSCRNDYKLLVS